MSNAILLIGESGTGKSTSIRTLPPAETFIINVLGKPLPFRAHKMGYEKVSSDWKTGNYCSNDGKAEIIRAINFINNKRPEIKYLVLDDFGYTITNNFMRKASQKGYDKFTDIGKDAFDILDLVSNLRQDLFCVVIMHTEIDSLGRYKPKTIGKMIDQHICIEGKFTYVFHSLVNDGRYQFLTNNDGQHMAKTPMDMFETALIDNDLDFLIHKIKDYDNEGALQ